MARHLTFRVASETYAVPLDSVSEIAGYPESLARVPTAPAWVRGVFNLRGSVVPAIDLAAKLGYGGSSCTKRTCVLLARFQVDAVSLFVGIIVDAVEDLVALEPSQIEPPPQFGSALRVECLLGTVRQNDKVLCVLDLVRLFRQEELLAAALTEQRERTATAQKEAERRVAEAQAAARTRTLAATETAGSAETGPGLILFED